MTDTTTSNDMNTTETQETNRHNAAMPESAEFPTEAVPHEGEETPSFALDAPVPEPNENPEAEGGNDGSEQQPPYTLELPAELDLAPEFTELLTHHAQAAGLPGKAAGAYIGAVTRAMQEREQAAIEQSARQLQQEWGGEFNRKLNAVKQFACKLVQQAGLEPHDLAPLQSPKGFRLLYALMNSVAEDAFVTHPGGRMQLTPAQEAHAMLTDPAHPDYAALDDPSHPRHMEANRKYNRLVGLA